ncbi:MAG: AMP-binding protein [Aquisalinus sp.]|nr:AMP-binding protein [Aquisalinus sp.]
MSAAKTIADFPQHMFLGRDVAWLLRTRAEVSKDKVFIAWESFTDEDAEWTYEAFQQIAERYAAGLAAQGIGKGDKVLIHMDNCPEFLFAWFGCALLGAVAVTTNTRCPEDEVAYFARHSEARLALTQPRYAAMVRKCMSQDAPVFCRQSNPGEPAEATIADGGVHSLSALTPETFEPVRRAPDPALPASVQYTSGTTSRPKGVVWTHANALWAGSVNSSHARLTEHDVTPVFLPLFHTNAIGYSVLATLWSGGRIILQPKFSASRFWDIATRHGCTWANMIGFTIQTLLGKPFPEDHKFRLWACAADITAIKELWGIKTIGWWGMTETVSHGTLSDLNWTCPEMSMGRPAPEYGVRILTEADEPARAGETGRLEVQGIRGLSLFLEYLNDPTATSQAFTEDGWLKTGDLVTVAPSGDLYFADREKDMLKIGGENVAASEIERVIIAIAGVQEAAIVGKSDPLLDEVPVAFVVPLPGASLTAEAVQSACAEHLADFKVPKIVHFLDELPKGTLDKVLKKELRARLQS